MTNEEERYFHSLSAFSALTLLVGWQKGHLACKNWVVRYWHGYLSGVRCKWFAYVPADATAGPSSLAPLKSRWFTYLVLAYLGCPGKRLLNWCSSRWWGGCGISWTICKSFAPRSRQITTPVPHHSVFTGHMPFLLPINSIKPLIGTKWSVFTAWCTILHSPVLP